ncbi:hypothetical protein B005_0754 [Nocardiopsis alba ATCC BAA-2165]|uniref:Uncharacterized protein n=1 Tax=Nocardiopsis alba (strain ATCC BAA-2165 / BE74) TaxID=1205910 RepID=J7L4L5_NOCAA|nr:hypothetical protein B005_0754 [Nocardiopsis alba ATCC BAA-2165]
MEERGSEHHRRGRQGGDDREAEQGAFPHALAEPAHRRAAQDDRDAVDPEQQAEHLRGDPVQVLVDEGGAGHVGEAAAVQKPHDEGVPQVAAVPEEGSHGAQAPAQSGGDAPFRGEGLGETRRHHQDDHHAQKCQRPEDAPPVREGQPQDTAAQDRRDHRGDRHDHHDQGEEAGERRPVEDVAHHGPREDHPGPGGEPLEETAQDQDEGSGGQRAQRGGQDEEDAADQEGTSPSARVADRTDDDLSHREPDQAGGEARLDLGRGGAEVGRDLREGRKVHVDVERAQHREHGEQEGQAQPVAPGRVTEHRSSSDAGERGRGPSTLPGGPRGVRGAGRT